MISHNHMYYHFKKMKPEYGKFKVLGENSNPYQNQGKIPTDGHKSYYWVITAVKSRIDN